MIVVMTGKLNIVLIGAGNIGRRWARAIGMNDRVVLRAVVDVDLAKARALAQASGNCDALSDWRDVLTDDRASAVIVATPHNLLAPISLAFVKAGKHVLSEKPAAIHSVDLKKIIAAAKKTRARFMVGFNHRFHEGFLVARKLVHENKIGKIMFIRARYGFGGREGFEKEWRCKKAIAGGGELIDQGVHMIDMARSFLGEFKDARGFTADMHWTSEVEDNAFVLLKTAKNQIASIHVSWSNWKRIHNFEIYGEKGYVIVEGLGRKYGGTEKVILGLRDPKYVGIPKEEEITCNPDADLSLMRELNEFADAIRERRDPTPNGADGYAALKIVEQIYKQNKK